MSKLKFFTTKSGKTINYCKKCEIVNVSTENEFCDTCKLKQYLSGIEEIKEIQSISSYANLSEKNMIITEELKKLHETHKRMAMAQ